MERPAPGVRPDALAPGSQVILVADGLGLCDALASALAAHDLDVSTVTSIEEVSPEAQAVVYLGGARPFDTVDEALQIEEDAFGLATRLAASFGARGGYLAIVQDTGGRYGYDGWCDASMAGLGGLAGLAKTAAKEWPEAIVRSIDLDVGHREPAEVAEELAAELLRGGDVMEVGLPEGARIELQLARPPLVDAADERGEEEAVVDASSVIVASGGARGVTAACLLELAERTKASFVLLGRTELSEEPACVAGIDDDAAMKRALLMDAKQKGEAVTPAELGSKVYRIRSNREIRETLASFEAVGARARYVAVDVRDVGGLCDALESVREEWGPITGLVHGAGVLADKRLEDKTIEQYRRVFDTKVGGLHALMAATAQDPLRLIALFSSVAGRVGNVGQSDYAMANEVLNKFAQAEQKRRGAGCLVKSINWGPWESGMVSDALAAEFARRGVVLIPEAVGAEIFADEVLGASPGDVEVVVGSVTFDGGEAPVDEGLRVGFAADPTRDPYLVDHAIDSVPVLPMVAALNWMAEAARRAFPGLVVEALRDVQVVKGARFDEGAPRRFEVIARRRQNGRASAELELRSIEGTLHYRASAIMGAETLARPAGAMAKGAGVQVDGELYDGVVLFHGPSFQVLRDVTSDDGGLEGALVGLGGLGEASWTPSWQTSLDPAALDGALQLAVLWTKLQAGGVSLPIRLGSVELYDGAARLDGPLHARLRSQSVGSMKAVSDVDITDAEGAIVASLRDVETYVYRR